VTAKQIWVCSTCGSPNVVSDATATWNVERQEWELGDVCDGEFCEDCGGETRVEEVGYQPEVHDAWAKDEA
jgi:hypothetical protein